MAEKTNHYLFFTYLDCRRQISPFHSVTMHRIASSHTEEIRNPIIKNRQQTNI